MAPLLYLLNRSDTPLPSDINSRWRDAFDGASVVIVPSRIESFGMVLLEAMLHGIPVLFTSTAGVLLQSECPFPEDEARYFS